MNSAPSTDHVYIRLRLRWRQLFRVGIPVVPAILFVGVALLYAFPSLEARLAPVVWGMGVVGWFYVMLGTFYLSFVPCPRCGKRFHVGPHGSSWNHFTSTCMNCGVHISGRDL